MVTTGAIKRAKFQWNRHHQHTNTQLFRGRMPVNSCSVSEHWRQIVSHSTDPKLTWVLLSLSLTTKGCWLSSLLTAVWRQYLMYTDVNMKMPLLEGFVNQGDPTPSQCLCRSFLQTFKSALFVRKYLGNFLTVQYACVMCDQIWTLTTAYLSGATPTLKSTPYHSVRMKHPAIASTVMARHVLVHYCVLAYDEHVWRAGFRLSKSMSSGWMLPKVTNKASSVPSFRTQGSHGSRKVLKFKFLVPEKSWNWTLVLKNSWFLSVMVLKNQVTHLMTSRRHLACNCKTFNYRVLMVNE